MAKIVEITQQSSVSCKIGGQASAEFSVTNITAGNIPVGVRVIADDPKAESWFELEGGPEWQFEQGENKPINVSIKVPKTASEGKRTFCIEVFSAVPMKGGIDFTTGEKMALEVTTPIVEIVVWPWIALAAVLVLLIGGGTTWYLLTRVPDVVGEPYDVAVQTLNEKEYHSVEKKIEVDASGEAGIVIKQDKGEEDEEGNLPIILSVAGVTLPDMTGKSSLWLVDKLIVLGLGAKLTERTDNSIDPNTVISHNPKGGEVIEKGGVVNVVLSRKSTTSTPRPPIFQLNKVLTMQKLPQLQRKLREFERDMEPDSGQAPAR
ncbi:MAG: PASTA domain-containing protein [Pseudomonadota bacterium]